VENFNYPRFKKSKQELDEAIVFNEKVKDFCFDILDPQRLNLHSNNSEKTFDSHELSELTHSTENPGLILENDINQNYFSKTIQLMKNNLEMTKSCTLKNKRLNLLFKKNSAILNPINYEFLSENSQIAEKLNSILDNITHISEVPTKILYSPFFKKFNLCQLIVHEKGLREASNYVSQHLTTILEPIEVAKFNKLYSHFQKTKSFSFLINNFTKNFIHSSGYFLAQNVEFQHNRVIIILSRNDFLPPSSSEILFFQSFASAFAPVINKIINEENSNKKSIILMQGLKNFPLPLKIVNIKGETYFQSDTFSANEEDHSSSLIKIPIDDTFTLIAENFHSTEFSGDLFHYQRIALLGELLNTLQHELSNPLFGLKMAAELWSNELLAVKESENYEFVSNIQFATERCQNIIKNFTSLYQKTETFVQCSLSKVINDTLILTKSETKNIYKEIIFMNVSEDITLSTNPTWLSQIIFNLVLNSAQAMNAQQTLSKPVIRIEIEILKEKNMLSISFIDSGPGINSKDAPNIFEPFYTTKEKGTGLGLAICKRLANKLGGDLNYVANKQESSGAIFKLILPVNEK
jgi:two-component system NtrC family sensor kinase